MKKQALLFLLLSLALLSGCVGNGGSGGTTILPPSPTLRPSPTAPTATSAPTSTTTPMPSPAASSTPGLATPTADLSAFFPVKPCVPPSTQAAPIKGLNFKNAPPVLLKALNSGVRPAALNSLLHSAGIGNYPLAAVGVDLNGDRRQDVVVSIFDPNSKAKPPQGFMLFFLCTKGEGYKQVETFLEPVTSVSWSAPTIQFAKDLNADGKDEIVVASAHCDAQGANCVEKYAILAWQNGKLVDLLTNFPLQGIPNAVAQVTDPDGDHIYDFVVTTGEGKKLVWKYQNGVWKR